MRAMKDSGIEWIGKIPKTGWNILKLKYSVQICMGQSPDDSTINEESGFSFMQGNAEFGKIYPHSHLFCESPKKLSKIDDILMSVRAPVGALNISDKVYCIGRGLCALRPKNINSGYLWYYLLKSRDDFSFYSNGSTFEALTINNLANFPIVIPNIDRQMFISSFLDSKCAKIDEYLSRQQQVIEKLKEYKQSVITEAVTKGLDPDAPMKDSGVEWIGKIPNNWSFSRLKFLGTIKGRIGFKGYTVNDIVDPDEQGNAVVIGGTNIMKDGYVSYDKLTYISEYKYRESPEIMLKGNEILITKVGAGTGENAIYLKKFDRVTINPNVMIFATGDMCLPKFANYSLLSYYIKTDVAIESHKSGAQPAINQFYIKNLKIFLPSKEEQHQIASYLDTKCAAIDAAIKRKQELIDKMTEYKKSLIYEAVTGKMEV